MGIEAVVDGKVEEAPVVEAAPIEAPAVEAPVAEAPVVETPEVVAAPAVEPVKEDKTVPLAVALDWRDERNRYKAEAEALRRPVEPAKVPDPYDDPNGFKTHLQSELDKALQTQKLEFSWNLAVRDHGEETAAKARDWAVEKAKSDPLFGQQLETEFKRQSLPIDWIVRQHKEAADIEDYRKDPAAFARRILEGSAAPMTIAPAVAEQQQAPATPPRSLASQPSKSGAVKDVPVHGLAALEAVFTR